MSSGKHRFRRTETMRAINATAAAVAAHGLKVRGVEFDGATLRVLVDEAPESGEGKPKSNPLDRVLDHAQDQKRPA